MVAPTPEAMPIAARRRHARFDVALRVEYEVQGRRLIAFTSNLSLTGMLLRSVSHLQAKQEHVFAITLIEDTQPIVLRGVVTGQNERNSRVAFSPGQDTAGAILRNFVQGGIIPGLEEEVRRPHARTKHIAELAWLYLDFGRAREAMQLVRQHQAEHAGKRFFFDVTAWVWMEAIQAASHEIERQHLLHELQTLCDAAEAHHDSPAHARARQCVSAWTAFLTTQQARAAEAAFQARLQPLLNAQRIELEQVTQRALAEMAAQLVDTQAVLHTTRQAHERDLEALVAQSAINAHLEAEVRVQSEKLQEARLQMGQQTALIRQLRQDLEEQRSAWERQRQQLHDQYHQAIQGRINETAALREAALASDYASLENVAAQQSIAKLQASLRDLERDRVALMAQVEEARQEVERHRLAFVAREGELQAKVDAYTVLRRRNQNRPKSRRS